ncbi:hypothetical protein LCL95_13525 [Bacillus timonensis]|nr:hypothetical protein [Bacillus timonensis]
MEKDIRYPKAVMTSYINNFLHIRNPNIIMWWSAALPGFGHIMLCRYLIGSILIIWEFFINVHSNLNEAIFYSFTGQFDLAVEVINPQLALLYVGVYFFTIWDSRRITIELNKLSILADRSKAPLQKYVLRPFDINYLEKRNPVLAMGLSCLTPGLGQLYTQNYAMGFYTLTIWVLTCYFSNVISVIHLIVVGDIQGVTTSLDMQWLLFMPSIYGFSVYNAYICSIELNKMFRFEQTRYFHKMFSNPIVLQEIFEQDRR